MAKIRKLINAISNNTVLFAFEKSMASLKPYLPMDERGRGTGGGVKQKYMLPTQLTIKTKKNTVKYCNSRMT